MNNLLQFLAGVDQAGSLESDWSLEGMGGGWLLSCLMIFGAVTWFGYWWGAPRLLVWPRRVLTSLRVAFLSLLLLLLARPVLHLTINKPVRGSLAVLIDDSSSMGIRDERVGKDDIQRAEIVLQKKLATAMPSRSDLVRALPANNRLGFWERLHKNFDLSFYSYARDAIPLGKVDQKNEGSIASDVAQILSRLESKGPATATGDALRSVLDQSGARFPAGILILSDGSTNAGSPVEEQAGLAREAGVPIFTYGLGVEAPNDIMVRAITGSRGVFKKENIEYQVRVRAPMHDGKTLRLLLREGGRVVKEEEIAIKGADENTFKIGYAPQEAGVFDITASIATEPGEASVENNAVSTRLRVLEDRIHVLYLEQEPRWDFRYLLAALERDKRLKVHCLLYSGDPVKSGDEGKPFISEYPRGLSELAQYSVIILGDVDPAELGEARMKEIQTWVADLGGAVVFLAGRSFNPIAYASTPLEKLLPVEIDPSLPIDDWRAGGDEPIVLVPTTYGEASPMFRLSMDTAENRKIWRGFPGVAWTARVAGARMGAQVLLEDSKNSGPDGPLPVVATMPNGQGAILYFGFDQTYRWRSRVGERHYAAIWAQIIQRYAIERQLVMAPRIQLKPERGDYSSGETIRVTGRIFDADFQPLKRDSVAGKITIRAADGSDLPSKNISIAAVPGKPGEFEAQIETPVAGAYTLTTELDPATITLDVRNASAEMDDTALDARRLRAIAETSGGRFLREENLEDFPAMLREKIATFPVITKIDPANSPWWLIVLIALVSAEWLLRRLWNLK